MERSCTYCVTGANGYVGSWLVKLLLDRGHIVHATVRHPEKSLHLLPLWKGGDRLRLFKADLSKEGSFDEAVKGCNGVFHTAASMEFNVVDRDDIETYVQTNIIDPAIKGTLNLLNSCLRSKSVKKIVFSSSISTLTAKDGPGDWRPVVDETCQTPIDHVWKMKASGWVYVLSKLLSEEAAFKFANENYISIVSVITTTVAGPFLTSTVPSSIQVLLSPITGDPKLFSILSSVNSRMGSIAVVHIEDICNAHIFLMAQSRAEGRYICGAHSCSMPELVSHLIEQHPRSEVHMLMGETKNSIPSEISSRKLIDLGFSFKHGIKDIIRETIAVSVDYGFLPPTKRSELVVVHLQQPRMILISWSLNVHRASINSVHTALTRDEVLTSECNQRKDTQPNARIYLTDKQDTKPHIKVSLTRVGKRRVILINPTVHMQEHG